MYSLQLKFISPLVLCLHGLHCNLEVRSSEASVNYQTARRHILEDSTLDFAWYYLTNRGPVMGRDVEFEKHS
jgi:hypothetical protein